MSSGRKRSGVSPVIATTIILAVTVTLGLSLWGFANSSVGTATGTYAEVITNYGKYTSDRFVIANLAFNHPLPAQVTVWVYNSGDFATEIKEVTLTCKDCVGFAPVTASVSQQIPAKSLQAISFVSGVLTPGNTYQVHVLSNTGAYQVHYQEN